MAKEMEHDFRLTHPSYLDLAEKGLLSRRASEAGKLLASCRLCPHECGVNRLRGEKGFCSTGARARVASFGPHFGEELPLRGSRGSGTIFFSGCNMKCLYCQNHDISQGETGEELDASGLARVMLSLQAEGCHNINLVTPSHVVPQIIEALVLAVPEGLNIPMVFNTGGYDSLRTLRFLEDVIDIYMPDMKYADELMAWKYSGIRNYPYVNRVAVKEMFRQRGDLALDDHGIAVKGLLVRHLLLPASIAGSSQIFSFLAGEISKNTFLNIMGQYFPCYRANEFPELSRRIFTSEYLHAVGEAKREGLARILQELY